MSEDDDRVMVQFFRSMRILFLYESLYEKVFGSFFCTNFFRNFASSEPPQLFIQFYKKVYLILVENDGCTGVGEGLFTTKCYDTVIIDFM